MTETNSADMTVSFYNNQAENFIRRTVNVDMQSYYESFLALVRPGGKILDAGCGSGRDSLYFQQHGYEVTAIDASTEMVKHTSTLIGRPVLLMRFHEVDFREEFDGVWASASLLHVPKAEIDGVIERLSRALVPGGIFYLSFKYGEREEIRHGRLFSDYTEESLAEMLNQHPQLEVLSTLRNHDARPSLEHEQWLNMLARKQDQ